MRDRCAEYIRTGDDGGGAGQLYTQPETNQTDGCLKCVADIVHDAIFIGF